MRCVSCGKKVYSKNLPICPDCARKDKEVYQNLHRVLRLEEAELTGKCCLCTNFCVFTENTVGLCGLRGTAEGKRFNLATPNKALLSYYEDPLPTNCCNAWFCEGSKMHGTNLAVFYYGCNFDCLFCQNWQHKSVEVARAYTIDEMVEAAMKARVKCICHFGGSPEPQLTFALRFSEKAAKEKDLMVCWEWNGGGREKYVRKAAEISSQTNGTIKFDLKAWNENLHSILTGRSNKPTLKNFEVVFDTAPEVISATTLMVPYYVDETEVEGIASFIASFDKKIPYSLLVFHPDYRLSDMPVTPIEQVKKCYNAAKKYLERVNIGNLHLLGWKFL
ncbi:MAG: radical SAM protein [Archaeoglobus sp.]|nr:radical SAM protein [Archaeoglobus sp.]